MSRLVKEVLGLEPYAHIIEPSLKVDETLQGRLLDSLKRLKCFEPLQYILGYQDFCGLRFNVSPAVLIPRPETEELVQYVVERCAQQGIERPRILDLCTGSGCIAWSLAASLQGAEVVAVDISTPALEVANSQNIDIPNPPKFLQADVLSDDLLQTEGLAEAFDVIVSNPPYVTSPERELMRPNVLAYEPELALFAPDDDFLIFFKKISEHAKKRIANRGFCIVEANSAFCDDVAAIFAAQGFPKISVRKDLNAKNRFVISSK